MVRLMYSEALTFTFNFAISFTSESILQYRLTLIYSSHCLRLPYIIDVNVNVIYLLS